jgi:hypothetical protein
VRKSRPKTVFPGISGQKMRKLAILLPAGCMAILSDKGALGEQKPAFRLILPTQQLQCCDYPETTFQ